jgi:hypothetical protein
MNIFAKVAAVLITGFVLITTSCRNDFEVVHQANPTAFVYCVLNATDSVHYIRINKSFITFDNVYDYVNRSDSLYYPDLDLQIELTDNISQVVFIKPEKIIYASKDSGLFAQDPNV